MSRIAYVSGRLGAGKSSLAAPLAAALGYSLVTKDLVKETLHDALYVPGDGEIDRAWSQRLSAASFELLWTLAARAGDMVIEANFHRHSEYELDKLPASATASSKSTAHARPRSQSNPATMAG